MTHHHTMRTALDIQQRLEDLRDRLNRAEDNRDEIIDDMRQIVLLVRR